MSLWLQFLKGTFDDMTSDHVIYLFMNLAKGGYKGTGKISDSEGG